MEIVTVIKQKVTLMLLQRNKVGNLAGNDLKRRRKEKK
jgi:hypothetical protein